MGCVADECDLPGRSLREGSPLSSALLIAAVLALAAGVFGLVRHTRALGHFGGIGRVGLAASGTGVVTVIIAILVQSIFFNNDFWAMPYFVIPGALALVIGCVLLGVALLRSGVLARWAAALVIIGALALLGMNEQNTQVLLAIPFGVAWVAVGYVLRKGARMGPAGAAGAHLPSS